MSCKATGLVVFQNQLKTLRYPDDYSKERLGATLENEVEF